MQKTKKIIPSLLVAMLLAVAVFSVSTNIHAQANTTCFNAQSYINNTLRDNDLRSRVDRLQLYEFMYTNLKTLSDRLSINNQPQASQMERLVSGLRTKIDAFKVDYESYDLARDKVGNLKKCNSNQTDFESLLLTAQNKRKRVAKDVAALHTILSGDTLDELTTVKGAVDVYAGGSL